MSDLVLDGSQLTIDMLHQASGAPCLVAITPTARERLRNARSVVDKAVADKQPVYGLTTGLGAQATQRLPDEAVLDFSYQTLRGRAHAIGSPLSRQRVRATMIVRLNTVCKGASGMSESLVDHLLACINADLVPSVGETGSIGAGDLVMNATLALSLLGEGVMLDADGRAVSAAAELAAAHITVPPLAPRDGLALANHSSFSGALASLAVADVHRAFLSIQTAAALSMQGFGANVSPLNPAALSLRPQPGQQRAADGLCACLEGSELMQDGAARRLQDPLAIRNLAQIHGALIAAYDFARDACEAEINGASDNPAVLLAAGKLISTGAYHTPHLTNAVETLTRACTHVAVTQVARLSTLLSSRFTQLPLFLAQPGEHSNGFAPLMKTAEALLGELLQLASPVPLWPSINADGVENSLTQAPLAAKSLASVCEKLVQLTAIELMIGAQAIDLRGSELTAPKLSRAYESIRADVDELGADRPMTDDVLALVNAINAGRFA